MQKKNTLLYLDQYLVEKAKKKNINISRVAEDALRNALDEKRPVTVKDILRRILREEPGNHISRFGERYFLPFQIESLKLNNIGPFEKFEASFSPDTLNIIYGPNGSGKSIILRSILFAFGRRHRFFNKKVSSGGTIKLKLFQNQNLIKISDFENPDNLTNGYGCWIADALLSMIPRKKVIQILNELASLGIQVIITTVQKNYLKTLPKDTRIISLENHPYYR